MSARRFSGERLEEGDALFGVDLAQHRAAYRFAAERPAARAGCVLDAGAGSGHGLAELARAGVRAVGVDRTLAATQHDGDGRLARADVTALPFRAGAFAQVVSFQVIEHLADPGSYLAELARVVREDGEVLLTTPNARTSLGVNPYHLREYTAEALDATLRGVFGSVEMRGVGAAPAVRAYLAARRRRIETILRLDPLRLRDRLPQRVRELLFARFAVGVRRGIRRDEGLPDVSWRDFPVEAATEDSLDLLAVCRP